MQCIVLHVEGNQSARATHILSTAGLRFIFHENCCNVVFTESCHSQYVHNEGCSHAARGQDTGTASLLGCCTVALAERRVWGDPVSGEGERHIPSPSKTQPVPSRSPGARMSPSTTKILLCSIRWVDRARGSRGWQTLIQIYFPLLNTLKVQKSQRLTLVVMCISEALFLDFTTLRLTK